MGLDEQAAHSRRLPAGIEHRRAARRVAFELRQGLRVLEHAVHVLIHGKAALGILDGWHQHLPERFGAVVLQEEQVGINHPWDGERQVGLGARTGWNLVQTTGAKGVCGGGVWRHALSAQGAQLAAGGVVGRRP